MRKYFLFALTSLLLFWSGAFSQQLNFNRVIDARTKFLGGITSIAQDRRGYIWFSVGTAGGGPGGVYRYDGSNVVSFLHDPDPKNPNSLASNYAECVIVDSSGIVWIGTFGSGLDRYDPSRNTFTLFKHDAKKNSSLANDSVTALLEDHKGNLWIGTYGGLARL